MTLRQTASAFWWRHARGPLLVFLILAVSLSATSFDETLARALFYNGHGWLGADSWWTNDFLHTGGRWAIRLIAFAALIVWASGLLVERWSSLKRPASYVALAIILSTGLVGLLKSGTNIDCPVDLSGFGGQRPHVSLFGDRPDNLPHAACFPAAHASSGYALFAFYFLWAGRDRRLARAGLALGWLAGLAFGIAQQSRGAHFLSHDVYSALIVWLTCLTLYVYGYRRRPVVM